MPEVIFSGPGGRLEGRFQPAKDPRAPIALVLHTFPQLGGSMDHPIVYKLFYLLVQKQFSVLRFNFRGVGRSQGIFDHGPGELADAASALDWAQNIRADARGCWIVGCAFGAWVGMQLLMRRPEVEGFVAVSPPANLYDFSFLAPCPSSGLVIHGEDDQVAPSASIKDFVARIKLQNSVSVQRTEIEGANHFFENHEDQLVHAVSTYLDARRTSSSESDD